MVHLTAFEIPGRSIFGFGEPDSLKVGTGKSTVMKERTKKY